MVLCDTRNFLCAYVYVIQHTTTHFFYLGGSMSEYRALYRKYRPFDFDDVSGQNSVTDILKYEVANGRLSQRKKRAKEPSLTLSQVALLSREAGLSYGKYVQKYNLG